MRNPLTTIATFARGLMQREKWPRDGQRTYFLGKSSSGVYVDHDVALTLGSVSACVRVVAETIGVLQWTLIETDLDTRARKRRRDLPVDRMLSLQPNPEMSSQTFREVLTAHALLRGNGFAEIVRDAVGRPAELWPLPPNPIPYRLEDGSLVYEFVVASQKVVLRAEDVFHIKGLSYMGTMGYDVISYMANSIGYGIGVEDFASEYFKNGAAFSVVLKHPRTLSAEAQKRLQEEMEQTMATRGERHRVKVLEEGLDIAQYSATAEQAQMVEARKLSIEDVARWFRVPLHKIGALDKATWNNTEHLGIDFVQSTLLPWAVRWETEACIKLLTPQQQKKMAAKMKLSTLARGDLKSRYDSYQKGRQWGWLTPNMIAEMEDAEPIPAEMGGDTIIIPMNYKDARVMFEETKVALEEGVENPTKPKQQALPFQDPEEDPDEETEEEEEDDDNPAGNVLRHSIASACRRVTDREASYMGRRFSNASSISEGMRNQTGFAHAELYPIARDIAAVHNIDPRKMEEALKAVTGRYYFRQSELWNAAVQSGRKPELGDLYATKLEEDFTQTLLAKVSV